MASRDPSWGKEATSLRTQHTDNFRQSLKDIAEGIARHEPSEKVLERHVQEAFSLLALAGNRRVPFYARHEGEVAIGGALLGASTSVHDFIEAFYPTDNEWRRAIIVAVTIVMIGVGSFLVIHGFLRVRRATLLGLPNVLEWPSRFRQWLSRPAVTAPTATASPTPLMDEPAMPIAANDALAQPCQAPPSPASPPGGSD